MAQEKQKNKFKRAFIVPHEHLVCYFYSKLTTGVILYFYFLFFIAGYLRLIPSFFLFSNYTINFFTEIMSKMNVDSRIRYLEI